MRERMKEHDGDIRLARTQKSAVSEHANRTGRKPLWKEIKFIDRDNHWYTWKVKEAIHIRLNPNNINTDNGAEIPEAWMPTVRNIKTSDARQISERLRKSWYTETIAGSNCTNRSRPPWYIMLCWNPWI